MEKRGQQEIAGFVIIVVLVMVAVFIFVIMYFANKKDNIDSKEVEVLVISLLKTTTDCYLEQNKPANLRELMIGSYESIPRRCKNDGKLSRDYLKELFPEKMKEVLALETNFEIYIAEIVDKSNNSLDTMSNGYCSGKETRGTQISLNDDLSFSLKVC